MRGVRLQMRAKRKSNDAMTPRHQLILDRDGKLHCVIALLAFERAHVEAGLGRLNAGKFHRLAALDARENADICDTK